VSAGDPATIRHGVHGLVTIELTGASAAQQRALVRRLGPSRAAADGPADITVRFVDRLPRSASLTYLGSRAAAYDEDAFYLLDGGAALTRIDLARAGQALEIVCERAVAEIPLLVPLLALRLIARGYVLVHAASFVHRGRGVLVAGWEGGGKSELLLPFVAGGADYLADEWTIVGGERATLHGIAADAQIWDWQLRQLPAVRRRLPAARRARVRTAATLERLSARAAGLHGGRNPAARALGLLDPGFHNNARVSGSPEELFDGRVSFAPAPLDVAFLATVVEDPASRARPIGASEFAARIVRSLAYERRALSDAYTSFRFAFPDRRSEAIERSSGAEEALLERALAACPAYALEHPKPLVLRDLYDVALPLCEA
jgi:hypothetical protein